MGHTEIAVTMNVHGHLFEGKQRELTSDLDALLGRVRSEPALRPDDVVRLPGPLSAIWPA